MDTRLVRSFRAVVECGSYAKAADRLGYTQSTITVHIKQLEAELGVALFERIGRRMMLTEKGAEALEMASGLIAAEDRLLALDGLPESLSGVLRVDVPETVICFAMDDVIAEFRETAPAVTLCLRDRTCLQVSENLRSGECDLGISYAFDWRPEDFVVEEVARTGISVVASANGDVPALDVADFRIKEPFIIDEPDSAIRRAFEGYLADKGCVLEETIELWSSQAIRRLVEFGMGFSVFPTFAVADGLSRGSLVEVPCAFESESFPLYLGHRKTHWMTPAANLFADLVRKHLPFTAGMS
ncbi:LysR family transcriptional regulator [uncultured Slackia sp.]|uniref:LysR family transcriptional regulator n=1 Tax=uncultured Slackia sp. TaxID=665903 RepID=UPI0026DA8E61|nr:LysR family transcriptional regulator [uncultured Slackia sp.]